MKAKLIKHILVKADEGKYFLFKEDENEFRTQLFHKLSKQNCDEIFGVVDVEKYISEDSFDKIIYSNSYKQGFNKAMELNKDKVFTLEDMRKAIDKAKQGSVKETHNGYGRPTEPRFVLDDLSYEEIIQSLQQPTEIEVISVMEEVQEIYRDGTVKWERCPKLDSSGNLILKKK
jgi:hypothetical protein